MTKRVAGRHELVRSAHYGAVLDVLDAQGPTSRVRLAEITGLSRPTISVIVAALEGDGVVREAGRRSGPIGRSATLYQLDPTAAYAIGVDLGGTKLRVALTDLAGTIIGEAVEPTSHDSVGALLDQIVTACRTIARRGHVPWKRVAAVGLGTPGVDDGDGGVALAPNLVGFEGTRIAAVLAERLRVRVVRENDVNLAAIGEQFHGAGAGARNLVVLSIGTGVGAGLIIDGELRRGARGAAGEASYLPIGADPRAPDARTHGALEVAASGSALIMSLRAALGDRRRTCLDRRSGPADIFAAAAAGDPLATELVDAHASVVAQAVLALSCLLDPEVVVLVGGVGANPGLLEPVRRHLAAIAPGFVRVETSALGPRSGVIGAVTIARREARSLVLSRYHPAAPGGPASGGPASVGPASGGPAPHPRERNTTHA